METADLSNAAHERHSRRRRATNAMACRAGKTDSHNKLTSRHKRCGARRRNIMIQHLGKRIMSCEDNLSGAVTHFEIYAEDPAKLADFYRGLFGWGP